MIFQKFVKKKKNIGKNEMKNARYITVENKKVSVCF